ncbi:hypothetical protein A2U01_0098248, partial [Trifolium medium]|nr:hypothetical protein [Trifolium medium]
CFTLGRDMRIDDVDASFF